MKTVALSSIIIKENRQRRLFDAKALNELVESIRARGLYHPIVLRQEGNQLTLVSGERRLRAITDIYALEGRFNHDGTLVPAGEIPYVTLGELSPLEAEEAELEENIRRSDLTWQEKAAATARLAALRNAQAQAAGLPPPPIAAVSLEVRGSAEGKQHEATRREILLAPHLSKPEVAAAKSADEAWKILKRQEEAARNVALAETLGQTWSVEAHTALNVDARAWLAECPAEQFDVILTDQPFGMGADEFGDSGVTGRRLGIAEHAYADDRETFLACRQALLDHALRITKPQAHLYWFCDIDAFLESRDLFAALGWWVHRTPLVWHKPNALRVPWADPPCGPRRSYELILYAVKGKRPVTKIYSDVISCPQDENLGHSAQKPVALYSDLLRRSVRPGDSVLDPFMGTGTIFPAAHDLKVRATGLELDPASYGIALRRLQGIKDATELEARLG